MCRRKRLLIQQDDICENGELLSCDSEIGILSSMGSVQMRNRSEHESRKVTVQAC